MRVHILGSIYIPRVPSTKACISWLWRRAEWPILFHEARRGTRVSRVTHFIQRVQTGTRVSRVTHFIPRVQTGTRVSRVTHFIPRVRTGTRVSHTCPDRRPGTSDVFPLVCNLKAVIWFYFAISSLLYLPTAAALSVLSFFCLLAQTNSSGCESKHWLCYSKGAIPGRKEHVYFVGGWGICQVCTLFSNSLKSI